MICLLFKFLPHIPFRCQAEAEPETEEEDGGCDLRGRRRNRQGRGRKGKVNKLRGASAEVGGRRHGKGHIEVQTTQIQVFPHRNSSRFVCPRILRQTIFSEHFFLSGSNSRKRRPSLNSAESSHRIGFYVTLIFPDDFFSSRLFFPPLSARPKLNATTLFSAVAQWTVSWDVEINRQKMCKK